MLAVKTKSTRVFLEVIAMWLANQHQKSSLIQLTSRSLPFSRWVAACPCLKQATVTWIISRFLTAQLKCQVTLELWHLDTINRIITYYKALKDESNNSTTSENENVNYNTYGEGGDKIRSSKRMSGASFSSKPDDHGVGLTRGESFRLKTYCFIFIQLKWLLTLGPEISLRLKTSLKLKKFSIIFKISLKVRKIAK